MDPRIKLGQRFTIGFPGLFLSEEVLETIKRYKIGNVILFKHNIESKEQLEKLTELLDKTILSATGIKPFIMIDQEGGMVSRLSSDYGVIPGAMAMAATDDIGAIEECGYMTGRELKGSGVNFNLAPVLDINSNLEMPVLGVRSYGESAEEVIKYAIPMIKGLEKGGVLSCAKHFPGHGDVAVDSHMGLPSSEKTEEELMELELKPYFAAIREGIPSIMTTHILFPSIDPSGVPATMSGRIIKGILREKMGFKGLVLTDCLEMGAIKDHFGTANGARMAFEAGVDIACISHHVEYTVEAIEIITKEEGWEDKQDEAFERIMKAKEKYLSLPINPPTPSDINAYKNRIEEIGIKTITPYKTTSLPSFDSDTVFISPHPFVVTAIMNPEDKSLSFSSTMAEHFGGKGISISINPEKEEIDRVLSEIEGKDNIVIGTYNAQGKKGQLELVERVVEKGKTVTVVALRNPYDLAFVPEKTSKIALYEYSEASMRWFIKYIEEKLSPSKRRPFLTKEED